MKYINQLKPAEVLLLKERNQANAKDLLKVTFLDLIIKKILEVKTFQKEIHRDEIREYKFVVRGSSFRGYRIAPYEEFYLSPFNQSRDLKLLIPNAIKIGFENSVHPKKLIETISQSLVQDGYLQQNFLQKIVGSYSLTPKGKEIRSHILYEISQLESSLPEMMQKDKTKAGEIIQKLGGSFYLLQGINFSLIHDLGLDELKEFMKTPTQNDLSGSFVSGCSGCSSWDSGYGSGDGSGCGGSGCSGCGGCGGGD